ncbi:MAG: type II toxin-antitoxin system HigB family toxin [Tepidisphaeraceae bacterium]
MSWLNQWAALTLTARWSSLQDVRKIFPHADGVKLKNGLVVTVFHVKGNEYRLLTRISYARSIVLVLDVLTHEVYDRRLWINKY